MATEDFKLDQVERDQQQQIRHRRGNRSRRRRLGALAALVLLLGLLVGAPSLLSHSSIGCSLLVHTLAKYDLESAVDSIRIGWITPLRIQGLHLHGATGSDVGIEHLDADVTIIDLIRSRTSDLGEVSVRGVSVTCEVDEGRCNLEDDLRRLMGPGSDESSTTARIKVQDIAIAVTDAITRGTWRITQSSAAATLEGGRTEATFAGVLTEPGGGGGSLQGAVHYTKPAVDYTKPAVDYTKPAANRSANLDRSSEDASPLWRLEISSESLPLSVATLVRRRVDELAPYVPKKIHGDATGGVLVQAFDDGTVEASIDDVRVRNLTAADEGSRVWSNGLATISGDLMLREDRVIGRQLRAATDFATATIDGAFSRTFSLVGANDNPLCWLNAIDGTATAEIDLAAFDRSIPGILPLRNDAMILSGNVTAQVESNPHGATRRSRLQLETEAIRARSRGQVVTLDPIELSAIVSSDAGQLRAEKFEWKSVFGSAIGYGDRKSGSADFEIDFGRLTAMLRPILQISETTLAGIANGSIKWNASADSSWRLSGVADAENLLITFPSGHSLRRDSLHGGIEAVGEWGGQSLQALNSAEVSLLGNGLDLHADLIERVVQPTVETLLPIRIHGVGRIETLTDTFGPWLPPDLKGLAGRFELDSRAGLSNRVAEVERVSLKLNEPSLHYAHRHFHQTELAIDFDGSYAWPANQLKADNLTVSGNAFSVRIAGTTGPKKINLDIQWRALLDRLQGSVRKPIASSINNTPLQQVGFQSDVTPEAEQWTLLGDCEGSLLVSGDGSDLSIDMETNAANLKLLQPHAMGSQARMVGPPTPNRSNAHASTSTRQHQLGQVVWSEPNLKLGGSIRYDAAENTLLTDSIQVAGDWFATTLKGSYSRKPDRDELHFEGPARLKMDEVAVRLSSLLGTSINADGVQETPLVINASIPGKGETQLSVEANVGWESASIAGVDLGRASIPVRLSETSVEIPKSSIPVGQGFLNLAGQVHYRPGPVWAQLERGVVAESIRLTPEMTDRWLKYLAPLAAGATQIEGTIGAEVDEAMIVFDQPTQSRVAGRLNVGRVQLKAGPMADQVLGGIAQLKSIAGGLSSDPATTKNRTLIDMPVQTVDFSVAEGVVRHERLFFEIDRARVVTSGRVSFGGQLNMIALVPLDERWLGNDLKGLAGQTVTLPIDGTLSRPSLDSSGLSQVVTQLGAKAIESTAENYLQQQLNRSLEKLFGR